MEEKKLASENKFKGEILTLNLDTVELPNGKKAPREVVRHPGAVSVVALEGDDLILVRQFRYPVQEILWEVPAGKLDAGEEPEKCAKRELYEETGYKCEQMIHLTTFYTTPGFSDEIMHLYLATDLTPDQQCLDEDEFVTVEKVPLKKAIAMIGTGEIKDAKSIVGIYMANQYVQEKRTVNV